MRAARSDARGRRRLRHLLLDPRPPVGGPTYAFNYSLFSSLLLSSLELSDTKVYEPYIRALRGTFNYVTLRILFFYQKRNIMQIYNGTTTYTAVQLHIQTCAGTN